jgi:hypothetical protein
VLIPVKITENKTETEGNQYPETTLGRRRYRDL